MKIRAIKLRIATAVGEYGFHFVFGEKLTIIRANNSSGKSTLVNTLLYGIGMEELIGGRDQRVLPSAVRDQFEYQGQRIFVIASEVLVEIENSHSEIITLRRAIKHDQRQSKLIEIFNSSHLTNATPLGTALPTYLHDSGGAVRTQGFHRYLEQFLGLHLPNVPTTSGGETKLYLQTIFAALAVEQKRGWTDYIAGIPFYGIRESRTRVVEYLLGLNVFESNALRNRLNAESVEIQENWSKTFNSIHKSARTLNISIDGIPSKPDALFKVESVRLSKQENSVIMDLPTYISGLRQEYKILNKKIENFQQSSAELGLVELDKITEELHELSYLRDQASTSLTLDKATLRESEALISEVREDLERNKTAQKLRILGANHEIALAADLCPTCNQPVEDSLLREALSGPQMDLEENITYLKSQSQMLARQISGFQESILNGESKLAILTQKFTAKNDYLNSLRGDMSSGATQSRASVRRQVQIEIEVEHLKSIEEEITKLLPDFISLAKKLVENRDERKKLPSEHYSEADAAKISIFEKMFRSNAGSFGYESAKITEIEINRDTLTPVFEQRELRSISKKTDLQHDSSASDFVRLIWSYLLGLYEASSYPTVKGNHPGILIFDEPGQHSMRETSQHSLLAKIAGISNLQGIVAASFDESQSVFENATHDIKFKLIEWEDKLIAPIQA